MSKTTKSRKQSDVLVLITDSHMKLHTTYWQLMAALTICIVNFYIVFRINMPSTVLQTTNQRGNGIIPISARTAYYWHIYRMNTLINGVRQFVSTSTGNSSTGLITLGL